MKSMRLFLFRDVIRVEQAYRSGSVNLQFTIISFPLIYSFSHATIMAVLMIAFCIETLPCSFGKI